MNKENEKNLIRCLLVRPHRLPEELNIDNCLQAVEKLVGGKTSMMDIPELGSSIAVIIREEADIFTPEKNRPLFDKEGKPCGCIYGNFIVAGIRDGMLRSLSDSELAKAERNYRQPYEIIIEKKSNFVACIPEQPLMPEA